MGKTINTILNLQDKFSGKLNEAGKNALIFKTRLQSCEGAAKKVDGILSGMAKTAAAVSAAGVAAMGAFAASCVKTYGEFQQSMSNVAGILGEDVGSEAYKKLESAAREAGKSTTKTAAESADALSYMALAGWSVEDSIAGLNPILRASEATGADLATTSDLVTDSMSALGLQTNELQRYLDVCARAQNKSNTTLTQMQEAYIGVGGTFKIFGTGLQESGALLGILANRGIKGSEAGNSLQSTLVNLTKQSGESAKAMKAIGVSAYDSQGKFKGITTVLKEVQAATADMTEEQRNNYLTMIAGKTQLTTLNALMSGLSNTLEDGTNEFQALYDTLGDCNGALDMMADTMTDNYAGALARAGSAMDDLKITIGQKLEPHITKFLNWFSEKLPGAAEKVSLWLDRNLPKAINFCKSAFEKIKPVISFVVSHFSQLLSVAAGVVAGLKAFSVITKVISLMNKLKTAETALKAVQLALNTSMLACPATWIATAVAGAVTALLLFKNAGDKARETNLAEHFGNIALSAEEIDKVVRQIVNAKSLEKLERQMKKFSALETLSEKLNEDIEKIEKTDWKISVGMNLDVAEQTEYKETIDSYVEDVKKYFEGAFQADWGLFEGNSKVQEALKKYYLGKSDQLNEIGADIKEAINKGLADNVLTVDEEKEIMNLMSQMKKIKEGLAQSEYETKMGSLQLEAKEKAALNGGSLTPETYDEIMTKAQEAAETYNASARERYAAQEAALKRAYKEGSPQYNEELAKVDAEYQSVLAATNAGIVNFTTNTLENTYSKELSSARQSRENLERELANKMQAALDYSAKNGLTDGEKFNLSTDLSLEMQKAVLDHYGVENASVSNINEILQAVDKQKTLLETQKTELDKIIADYSSKGETAPTEIQESYETVKSALEAYDNINLLLGVDLDREEMNERISGISEEVGSLLEHTEFNTEQFQNMGNLYIASCLESIRRGFGMNYEPVKADVNVDVQPKINMEQRRLMEAAGWSEQYIQEHLSKNIEVHNSAEVKTDIKIKPPDTIPNFMESLDFFKPAVAVTGTVKPKTVIDKPTLNESVNENREEIKLQLEKEFIRANMKADVTVQAGNINTSGLRKSVSNTVSSQLSGFSGAFVPSYAKGNIGGKATGTPYFGGGLTQINEHGGEIINLPTGAQIIPSDKSAQMVRESAKYKMPNISFFNMPSFSFKDTPYFGRKTEPRINEVSNVFYSGAANNGNSEKQFGDINISVNIGGNIIGLENAADEIGGKVCEQIVDMVRAM
mgnify:CR=1 FL=1